MEYELENQLSFKDEVVVATNGEYHIFIFCTSLRSTEDVQIITPVLNAFPEIVSWTVDLEDCDSVLRIVGKSYSANEISAVIKEIGFNIWEMPD